MKLQRGDSGAKPPASMALSASCSMKGNFRGSSRSARATRSPSSAARQAARSTTMQAGVEIGRREVEAERAAVSLKSPRERAAAEIHEIDHVVGRGDRLALKVDSRQPRRAPAASTSMSGVHGDDARIGFGRDAIEEQPAEDRPRKAAATGEAALEAREIDDRELDLVAQGRIERVEPGRDVAGLADDEDVERVARRPARQATPRRAPPAGRRRGRA